MGYAESVFDSPYAWILAVAIALGITLRHLILLLADRKAPARTRDRRLTLLFVCAAVTVALATASLLVFGPQPLAGAEALIFFGVMAALATLALVFLRAVGIPLLFLLSAFGVLGIYLAEPWQPVGAGLELARVTVLSAAGGDMRLELRPYPGEPTGENVVRLPGDGLGATVEIVRYHPYWFLLGRELGARVVAFTGYDTPAGGAVMEDLLLPDGCADPVCRFIRGRMPAIPGIDIETVRTSSVPAAPLARYRLIAEPPGRVILEAE